MHRVLQSASVEQQRLRSELQDAQEANTVAVGTSAHVELHLRQELHQANEMRLELHSELMQVQVVRGKCVIAIDRGKQ